MPSLPITTTSISDVLAARPFEQRKIRKLILISLFRIFAKTVFCNKKPGVERRADPPILRAIHLASRADVLDARIRSTRCLYPNSPLG